MGDGDSYTDDRYRSDAGVPPEDYRLYDEETGKYWCPFCGDRMLRIGDYAECTECGETFTRNTGSNDD